MQPIDYNDDSMFKKPQSVIKNIPEKGKEKPCILEADELEMCNRMYGANDFNCKGSI